MKHSLLTVGTEKGLFLFWSDTKREQWRMEGPCLKGWMVQDVLLDCRSRPTLFAPVSSFIYGSGIHVSEDFGVTWREIENPPQYPESSSHKVEAIWTLTPGPVDEPDVLYAGVDEAGLFISRDRGDHWENLPGLSEHPTREEWMGGKGGLCCHSVLADPTNPKRIWVGISAVGVFRTDDGGENWITQNDGLEIVIPGKNHPDIGTCVHRLVLDPTDPKRLFQQNHRGVFRSIDAGDTWQRIETGLPHKFGFPMSLDPNSPETLYLIPQESDEFRLIPGGELTVYRSTDRGDSWHPSGNGLPKDSFAGVLRQAMTVDSEGGVFFGTTGGQLFFSTDRGDHWQELPQRLPRINSVSIQNVER